MKHILISLTCLLVLPLRAEDDDRHPTVPCGKDTAVEYRDTRSPDWRFAFGWTVRPIAKDAEPVDWARYEKEGEAVFKGYHLNDKNANQKPTHQTIDGVIDFRSKSFKPFPKDNDIFLGGYHHTGTRWVDAQHAIILVAWKWHAKDVFFVSPSSEPVEVVSILPQMDRLIWKLIHENLPLAPEDNICISYNVTADDHTASAAGAPPWIATKIKDGFFHVSFSAGIPKNYYEEIHGHLLISIKDGKPLKAICEGPGDHPFVGELGEADKQMNQVYGKIHRLLVGDALKHLVDDQKKWISVRNEEAYKFASEKVNPESDGTSEEYREVRNRQALKLTRERTEILQKQFESLAPKSRFNNPRQN